MLIPFDPSAFESSAESAQPPNRLRHYLHQQSPEDLTRIAQSVTPEVQQLIAMNIQAMLGTLPSEHFNVQVATNRDNLAALLASAMNTGYFLRQVEQRMELEQKLAPGTTEER